MATPQVPPRPTKARHASPTTGPDLTQGTPKVPPRPMGRRKDRSTSPDRYAPSPLNDMPRKPSSSGLYSNAKQNRSNSSIDVPPRPPSVNLPSLGQEGNEYGELELHEQQQNALDGTKLDSVTTTSHVDSELPLHAPKPALSKSSAKAQVAAVTRTDSSQAAAALGMKSPPRDDPDPFGRPLKSKTSSGYMRSTSALSNDRPSSASQQLDAHGIPQIGQHVPLLFNAGDVQAPSPAPGAQIGSMSDSIEDLRQQRHHRRKHSGREVFHGPPGSYGLHGHGTPNTDQFEKSWYAKHPEEQIKEEQGHYGSALAGNRPEFALSSDDLNKLVRNSAQGAGFGTARNIAGLPDEQIGYMASDEYANRLISPRSQSGKHRRQSNSQTHVESPLRKSSFAEGSLDPRAIPHSQPAEDDAIQHEPEEIIHIDPPEDPVNRITGEGVDAHEGHGHRRTSSDFESGHDDRGYHAPILASDEARPGSEWQQPAMSPSFPADRRGSAHFDDFGGLHRHLSHLGGSASSSRAGSRPGSIHGIPPLTKIHSHDDHEERYTPLEDVEEYEPLFPDDDGKLKKATTPAERFKQRPDMRQRFPSQDIWEDTPDSLRLETEVTSPEPAEQRLLPESADPEPLSLDSGAQAMKPESSETEKRKVLTPYEELRAKRPGVSNRGLAATSHRFPSQDIWEDSPDYASLTTIVMDPEEQNEIPPPVIDDSNDTALKAHPDVPPRPMRTRGSGASQEAGAHPSIPPRPPKKKFSTESAESVGEGISADTDTRKAPSIPDRPKPHVPSRPSKSVSRDSNDGAPLSKSISAGSGGSVGEEGIKSQKPPPPTVKAKPNIPMRPAGGKIAALQAGFMADLNSRLKVGPAAQQPPKKEEAQEEKVPLQDARKSRARGPTRRKPGALATSPLAEVKSAAPELSFSTIWTVWHSDPAGSITVPAVAGTSAPETTESKESLPQQPRPNPLEPAAKETTSVAEPESLHGKDVSATSEENDALHEREPEIPVQPTEGAAKEENSSSDLPIETKDELLLHAQPVDSVRSSETTKPKTEGNAAQASEVEPPKGAEVDTEAVATAIQSDTSTSTAALDPVSAKDARVPSGDTDTAAPNKTSLSTDEPELKEAE